MLTHIYRVAPTINNIELSFDAFSKDFTAAVKSGKSSGPDEISASDLKLNENASKEGLFRVLTQSVKSGSFPNKWKTAKVCCAHKKGSTKDCSNYRPISLLSIPSKVVEKFICNQMQSHIHTFNLQTDNQWGFRAQRSTEDLLLHMTEQWRKAVDEGKVVAVLFLDFKKKPLTAFHMKSCSKSFQLLAFLGTSTNSLLATLRIGSNLQLSITKNLILNTLIMAFHKV